MNSPRISDNRGFTVLRWYLVKVPLLIFLRDGSFSDCDIKVLLWKSRKLTASCEFQAQYISALNFRQYGSNLALHSYNIMLFSKNFKAADLDVNSFLKSANDIKSLWKKIWSWEMSMICYVCLMNTIYTGMNIGDMLKIPQRLKSSVWMGKIIPICLTSSLTTLCILRLRFCDNNHYPKLIWVPYVWKIITRYLVGFQICFLSFPGDKSIIGAISLNRWHYKLLSTSTDDSMVRHFLEEVQASALILLAFPLLLSICLVMMNMIVTTMQTQKWR